MIACAQLAPKQLAHARLPTPHLSVHQLPRRRQSPHQECAAQTIARACEVLGCRRAMAWVQVARKQSACAQLAALQLNVQQLLRWGLPLAQPRATPTTVHVCDVPKRRSARAWVQVAREQSARAQSPPLHFSVSQLLCQRLPLAQPRATSTAIRVCNVLKRHGVSTSPQGIASNRLERNRQCRN